MYRFRGFWFQNHYFSQYVRWLYLVFCFFVFSQFRLYVFEDAPGFPVFVNNTVDTITIRWSPIYLQSATYTVNIRPGEETTWMNATCKQTIWNNKCTVTGTVAEVVGLEEDSAYHFRVYANYRGVRSDASLPSGAFRTAGDVELCGFMSFCHVMEVFPSCTVFRDI